MFQWGIQLSHVQIQYLRCVAAAEWDPENDWWYHENIGHLFTNSLTTERSLEVNGLIFRKNVKHKNRHTEKMEDTTIPVVTEKGRLILLAIEEDARDLSKTSNVKRLSAGIRAVTAKERKRRRRSA